MKIGRKIYFEKTTGNIIQDTGEMQGNVYETTREEDFTTYKALIERVPGTVGVIKLEYGQYQQDFERCNGYRINPDTKMIEFSYPDPNLPPEEPQKPIYQVPLSEQIKTLETALLEMSAISALQEQKSKENEQAILELTMLMAGGI